MYKGAFSIILLILIPTISFAQLSEDSTLAVNYATEARRMILAGNFEEAMNFTDESLKIYSDSQKDLPQYESVLFHTKGTILHRLGNFARARENYVRALKIRKSKLGEHHPDVLTSYLNLGALGNDEGNPDAAIYYLDRGLEAEKKLHPPNPPLRAKFFTNLAISFEMKGNYLKGQDFHQRALEIREKELGPNHESLVSTYINLSALMLNKGDFGLARDYLNQGLEIVLHHYTENHPDVGTIYDNLGLVYHEKRDYDKSLDYFHRSEDIKIQNFDSNYVFLGLVYTNIGNLFLETDQLDSAEYYHQKALEIWNKNFGDTPNYYSAATYGAIGETLTKRGKYQSALENLNKSLKTQQSVFGEKHPLVARVLTSIGNLHAEHGKYEQAYEVYEEAEQAARFKSVSVGPGLDASVSIELFDALVNLGITANRLYHQNKEVSYLNEAAGHFSAALAAKNVLKKNLTDHESLKELIAGSTLLTEWAIINLLDLYYQRKDPSYVTESFLFAENGKNLLLFDAFREANAKQILGIDDSLLIEENDLKSDITYLEKQIGDREGAGAPPGDSMLVALNGRLSSFKRSYRELQKVFADKYPKYFSLKFDDDKISIDKLKTDVLDKDQSLLSYVVGDSTITIFLVEKSGAFVHQQIRTPQLKSLIEQMRTGLYGFYISEGVTTPSRQETIGQYTEAAQKLYDILIRPFEDSLQRKVTVIPDGILGYVPFELLLKEKPPVMGKFDFYPFFMTDHMVSYNYSASLLREMQDKSHSQMPEGELLGVAPTFGSTSPDPGKGNPGNLRLNREEVEALIKIIPGQKLLGTEATEDQYKKIASGFRFHHLSTHGIANDSLRGDSYLLLADSPANEDDGILYLSELYNLPLNADMVVLSACETGLGQLWKGEGILSLSRAFAYAGAKSIVTTLWSVDEAATQLLMKAYYSNLKSGMEKDEALWKAKKYLMEEGPVKFRHPYFWAGFIVIGDLERIR